MQSRLLKFTNSLGESITFRDNSSFIVSQISGLGDVGADIQLQQAPFQDGATFIESVLEPRPISFTVTITGNGDTDISEKRSQLARVFNPKIGPGLLEYKYGNVERKIYGSSEHVPFFPTGEDNRTSSHQIALIDLICPDPYWKSLRITEEPAFEGLFQFPFEGEFQMGIQRDERIIINDGDAPAPIHVIFYGPAQTPTIANITTGEFIKINRALSENEKLIVDTSDENKSVYFENENDERINVFHWIDLDSTFFKLQVGENEISCLCATSNLSRDFEIYYHKLYTAV